MQTDCQAADSERARAAADSAHALWRPCRLQSATPTFLVATASGLHRRTASLAIVCAAGLCWAHDREPVIATSHGPQLDIEMEIPSHLQPQTAMPWLASCTGGRNGLGHPRGTA
jgi:hypothetical protein